MQAFIAESIVQCFFLKFGTNKTRNGQDEYLNQAMQFQRKIKEGREGKMKTKIEFLFMDNTNIYLNREEA